MANYGANDVAVDDSGAEIGVYGGGDAEVDGAGRPVGNMLAIFTGKDRHTPEMDLAPELGGLEVFAGEDKAKVMALLPLLALTVDPDEIGAIVTEQFPNISLMYNKDAQGDLYPLLANAKTGKVNQINKPGFSAIDGIQAATTMGAYLPAGRVGLAAPTLAKGVAKAVAANAATEGGIQGAQQAAGGSVDPRAIGISGAVGAAGPVVDTLGSAITRQRQGVIPRDAASVIDVGAREGVPVLTSDVVQPRGFVGKNAMSTGEKVPIVGTGGLRTAQQEARENLVGRATSSAMPEDSILVSEFGKEVASRNKKVGDIFTKIEQSMEQVGDVSTSKTRDAINKELARLNNPRVSADPTDISRLEGYLSNLDAGQTFADLDKLRTDFRVRVRGDRLALPQSTENMANRVYDAMSADLRGAVGDNLGSKEAAKWWGAKEWWGKEMSLLKDKRLANLLNKGESTPELVRSTLLSAKPSDLTALHKRLTPNGKAAARTTIIDNMVEKGTTNNGLTPDAFATQLRKHKKVIDVFFSGRDAQQLKGLEKLLMATRRGQAAGLETPTGQSMWGILGVSALADAGASAGGMLATLGGISRVYESKPVRDALLRLSTVPRGVGNYDNAIIEAAAAINAAAHIYRSAEAEKPDDAGNNP